MSAFGGEADVIQGVAECPLIAISGHSGQGEAILLSISIGVILSYSAMGCLRDEGACIRLGLPNGVTANPSFNIGNRFAYRDHLEPEAERCFCQLLNVAVGKTVAFWGSSMICSRSIEPAGPCIILMKA